MCRNSASHGDAYMYASGSCSAVSINDFSSTHYSWTNLYPVNAHRFQGPFTERHLTRRVSAMSNVAESWRRRDSSPENHESRVQLQSRMFGSGHSRGRPRQEEAIAEESSRLKSWARRRGLLRSPQSSPTTQNQDNQVDNEDSTPAKSMPEQQMQLQRRSTPQNLQVVRQPRQPPQQTTTVIQKTSSLLDRMVLGDWAPVTDEVQEVDSFDMLEHAETRFQGFQSYMDSEGKSLLAHAGFVNRRIRYHRAIIQSSDLHGEPTCLIRFAGLRDVDEARRLHAELGGRRERKEYAPTLSLCYEVRDFNIPRLTVNPSLLFAGERYSAAFARMRAAGAPDGVTIEGVVEVQSGPASSTRADPARRPSRAGTDRPSWTSADTARSSGAVANTLTFRLAVGIDRSASTSATLEESRRAAKGIYREVLETRRKTGLRHVLLTVMMILGHVLQFMTAVALIGHVNGVGPGGRRWSLGLTMMGTLSMAAAVALPLLKDIRDALQRNEAELRKLQDWIEETEALISVGIIGSNMREVGLLVEVAMKKYNQARSSREASQVITDREVVELK